LITLDVIRHFGASPAAPIDIEDDIIPFLRDGGIRDDLWFWPVELDDSKLRGKLVHWEPWDYNDDWAHDYDRPRRVGDIYVSKSLEVPWQRVIACKELLHVLDPPTNRVAEAAEVERLVKRIVLPLGSELAADYKTLTDTMGLYEALAVLFPWRVRENLMSAYLAEKLTAQQIAEYVEIPLQYVYLVMSDIWPQVHGILCPPT